MQPKILKSMEENTFQAFTYPEADGFGQLIFGDGSGAVGKPVILVTNDDGWQAGGIQSLVQSLRGLGTIVVCAPDSPRSGFGASFTCTHPLTLERLHGVGCPDEYWFSCSGTPVDCVKMAFHRLFHSRKPDLLVSGINHGSNDSICIMYSGTMGAVLEGSVVGVPAIGFSMLDHRPEADFTHTRPYVRNIVERVLGDPEMLQRLSSGVGLNVNIPMTPQVRGVRLCRQADGVWVDEYHYLEGDENSGKATFQVTGRYVNREPEATDTDRYWLEQDCVSIVPVRADYTDLGSVSTFKALEQ